MKKNKFGNLNRCAGLYENKEFKNYLVEFFIQLSKATIKIIFTLKMAKASLSIHLVQAYG